MRHSILTALIVLALNVQAQVPHWRIHPNYESIEMIGNGLYLVSNKGKFGVLNDKEKVILPPKYDKVGTFKSHYAVLFENDKPVAYISDKGRLQDISSKNYEIVGVPVFHDGYLLVYNSTGFYYIHGEDDMIIGPFSGGASFSEGYASVRVPKKLNHVLDGDNIPTLISAKTGLDANLNLGDYDNNDIDFISSVSNGKVIVALKKRFYEYDIKKETLTPLSTDGNLENKKSRVMAKERPVKIITTSTGYSILTNQGSMNFDPRMRLNSISYVGQFEKKIPVPEEIREEKDSPIKSVGFNGTDLLGLSYDGKTLLTAQFEKLTVAWKNEVVAMQNGKYGVIAIEPNQNYRFVLNDNLPIGFEHKTITTSIKAVCPPDMNPSMMTLTSEDENCIINTDTRQEKKNVETAVLSYQCVLNIPEEIGLEKSSADTRFSLNYDGLKLTPAILKFDTWYINNYNVQLLKNSTDGAVANVDIQVSNNDSNGKNFFRDVTVEASDSVICHLNKITEDIFNARFFGWKDGRIRFSVDITEDGCPTITYAFTVNTNSAKKNNQSEAEEQTKTQARLKRKTKSRPKAAQKKEEKKVFIPN